MSKDMERILDEVCGCEKYCFLKDLFARTHKHDQRNIEQLKCVEKFKYDKSFKQNQNIEWEGALDLWIREGYAAKFSEVYDQDLSWNEIYKRLNIK